MGRLRDRQKSKVFRWERQYQERHKLVKRSRFNWANTVENEMTLAECKALADKVCKHWKIRERGVEDGRGCRSAYSMGGYIKLPRWARQPVVVLHEMAHEVIGATIGQSRVESHGREFLGVEMYLLVKFAGFDIKELVKTANEAGLLFDSIHTVKARLNERRKRLRERAAA